MTRKKKKRPPELPAGPALDAAPLSTALRGLLADVKLTPKAETPGPLLRKKASPVQVPRKVPAPAPPAGSLPSETLRGEDKIAFHQAMAGVRPVTRRVAPDPRTVQVVAAAQRANDAADDEVRARLAALVAGDVRFDLAQDGERVLGRRAGLPLRAADDLSRRQVVPEATLDLHGERSADAERILVRWLRAQHQRGARRVCVVHGKGLHSEAGLGVLRDRVVRTLTAGGAAPLVRAFASAHAAHGGSGALLVELMATK